MTTFVSPSVTNDHLVGLPHVPVLAAARIVMAALVMVVALVVVLFVASQADVPADRSPSTPGVVVTPHPEPAGY